MSRAVIALALVAGACGGGVAPITTTTCRPPDCTPSVTTYAVEVAALNDPSLPPTEFTAVSLDSTSGTLTLSVPAAAHVTGHVLAANAPVAGTVLFSRSSRIAGRPDVTYQATIDSTTGAYAVDVPPNITGEQYTVRMSPTASSSYAPVAKTMTITADTNLDLPVATGSDVLQLHGALVDVVNDPVSGARVVLRDAGTLADLSTAAITDAYGLFSIDVSDTAASAASGLVLAVESGDTMHGLLTLAVRLQSSQLGNSVTQADFMNLQFPALPSATSLTFKVHGIGSSGTSVVVPNAAVRFDASLNTSPLTDITSVSISHEVAGLTDATGAIQVGLFSNAAQSRTYTVTVVPPADSDFESTQQTITVATTGGYAQTLTLQLRPHVTGSVVDADNAIVVGALLQPTPALLDDDGLSAALATTLGSATTGRDGRFSFRVDAGRYDLELSPPAQVTLPRTWLPGRSISADIDLGALTLPASVTYGVLLRDANAMPIQATVRLYVVRTADASCDATVSACTPAPQLEAEGTTGLDGTASLLLPAN